MRLMPHPAGSAFYGKTGRGRGALATGEKQLVYTTPYPLAQIRGGPGMCGGPHPGPPGSARAQSFKRKGHAGLRWMTKWQTSVSMLVSACMHAQYRDKAPRPGLGPGCPPVPGTGKCKPGTFTRPFV